MIDVAGGAQTTDFDVYADQYKVISTIFYRIISKIDMMKQWQSCHLLIHSKYY